jgi:hypothetical protein
MRLPRSYHPFLVGIYPVLFLYAHNSREVDLDELILPLALVLATTLIVRWAARRLVRDPLKADLLATTAVAVLFAYVYIESVCGWIADALNTFVYGSPYFKFVYSTHIFILSLVPAALLAYRVSRLKSAARLTSVLNTASVAVVGISLCNIAWAATARAQPRQRVAAEAVEKSGPLPNIFYIILDGYSRSDFLKAEYGLDNEPFLTLLEREGFYVARRSTANYCYTGLSLASSLNYTYLDEFVDPRSDDLRPLRRMIGDNAVRASLQKFGYRFVTFQTGYNVTEIDDADARLVPKSGMTNFQWLVHDATPLGRLNRRLGADAYKSHRDRILFALDELPRLARSRDPQFAFVHVLAAHSPFVFGENGQDVSRRDKSYSLQEGADYHNLGITRDEYRKRYRAQVEFLTRKVAQAIGAILKESRVPPIIIVQSDHGSGIGLDMSDMEKTDLPSRLSILNAYYLPYGGRQDLYDSISPVNTFRVVLNHTFGAKLDLLPDRSYYSKSDKPYEFFDVTSRVRPAEEVAPPPASPPLAARPR